MNNFLTRDVDEFLKMAICFELLFIMVNGSMNSRYTFQQRYWLLDMPIQDLCRDWPEFRIGASKLRESPKGVMNIDEYEQIDK